MTLIDFKEYYEVKEKMLSDYENKELWYKKVINNIAKAGFFSSDRTIGQYENEIWKTKDKKQLLFIVFRAVSNFILEQFYPSLDSKEKNNMIIK